MFDYFKYLLSPIILAINAYGLWRGGDYAWLGVGVLVSVLLFDALLKNDFSLRNQRHVWIYDVVVSLTVLAGFANLLFYVWLVGQNHFEATSDAVGALVSMMFIGFVVAAPPVHELFHRENAFLRWLGRVGLCLILDPWREITHVITHHLRTATPDDPDYARRGDTVYGHFLRTFPAQWKEAYHLEKMMWTKRGRAWWDVRNPWVYRVSQLIVFAGILVAVGGVKGAAFGIASCLFGPRLLLEIFNYVSHYGLVSATPGRFLRHHTWNHVTPLVRILALEITNHAGHHDDSYKPFYGLVPDRTGPIQPHFFLCVLATFVPPIWFAMIKPRLRDWDERFATPQEREIAWRENARAGWHDMNPPSVRAQLRPALA